MRDMPIVSKRAPHGMFLVADQPTAFQKMTSSTQHFSQCDSDGYAIEFASWCLRRLTSLLILGQLKKSRKPDWKPEMPKNQKSDTCELRTNVGESIG